LKKDEFEFLWEKSQEHEKRIKELEEAVNTLLNTTHKLDMEHRPIGPGPNNYGRGWKNPKHSVILGDPRGPDGRGI
jgi:hypothetical protein